jgi:hypothetical protein
MPLLPGKGSATRSHNVAEMLAAGHPLGQALAAAYRVAGEKRPKRKRKAR